MNYRQFANRHGITLDYEWADSNPNMAGDTPMNHYTVTLKRARRRMTLSYSMGLGLSGGPDVDDVLNSLALDSHAADETFEDWASEYGFDTDSRNAERLYKTCQRQTEKLKRFLGADMFDELLTCEES